MSDDREFVADPIIDEHFSHRTGPSALSSQTTTLKETAMAQQGVMTGKPSIESDRVEGTSVYDPQGNDIGGIKRLLIEKTSGRVAYSVMSFGGFLGMGEEEHAVPWSKLTYDTNLGGYRTEITEQQLRGAPTFTRDSDWDWSDRSRERQLHDYYRAPYYWG
jgi:hypothetical protein